MKRRDFITKGFASAAGIVTGLNCSRISAKSFADSDFLSVKFPLRTFNLPPVETGESIQGKQVFKLNIQQGETRILPDTTTQTLGINQSFLAPVLQMKKGQTVKMQVNNQLNEPVALHWHGMILPASEDGGPHQEIAPNKTWNAEWKVINDPSTLFYHSHTHHKTGEQVWKGLGGQMQIIDEERDKALNLPHEYGVDDYPVIIMDRSFDEAGEFYYNNQRMNKMQGMHGNVMLVNGVANSVLEPEKTRIRLRLHNASNARFYDLVFSDLRTFELIATDGGLLSQAITTNRVRLAPSERAEIIVDLSDRKSISLRTVKGYGNLSMGMMRGMVRGNLDQTFDLMHIDPRHSERVKAKTLSQLVLLPDWSNQAVAQTRKMNLEMQMGPQMMFGNGGLSINGQSWDMNVVNETLKVNTFEIWELQNPSMMHHPFHVHNTQFKVLERNGKPPLSWELGLKDTVTVHKDETVKILLPTGPYSSSSDAYMYHCHILEHEDAGMMGQFIVV
ncbi:multicopper oxidase domain-containing protein [Thiomicrorhabdus sp. 6S2-11]|uniref:Multicopper oxidase domain-containing protein n=1 Tax=Thiomicrorhabdus marina TaxID=2818442 RepID=A0ABS3Q8L8_9GAMM|nr:multicopper oxidase domain-containing protein [Thiomicrorhabdus marina]MBO1928284.1 multicopper oxidase domain-containing protein [Thiomicrorhabdus marina]